MRRNDLRNTLQTWVVLKVCGEQRYLSATKLPNLTMGQILSKCAYSAISRLQSFSVSYFSLLIHLHSTQTKQDTQFLCYFYMIILHQTPMLVWLWQLLTSSPGVWIKQWIYSGMESGSRAGTRQNPNLDNYLRWKRPDVVIL
jgi:hypothetical protein